MSGLRRYQGVSGVSGLGSGSARVNSGSQWGRPGGGRPRRGLYWLIKSLLALVGLAAVAGGGYLYLRMGQDPELQALAKEVMELRGAWRDFDPEAARVYLKLGRDTLKGGNFAEAAILRMPVVEGRSESDVEQAMKAAASQLHVSNSNAGEMIFHKDGDAKNDDPHTAAKMLLYCDARTAKAMLDHSDAYSALLPCRITLSRDSQGRLWLYAFDLDLLISGGKPLPPELREEALKARDGIIEIMRRGAGSES